MLESEGHVTVRTFLTLGTCVTTCDHSVICAWTAIKGLVCISGHTTARSVLMVKVPVTTKGNSGASFQLGHADLYGLCWHPKPWPSCGWGPCLGLWSHHSQSLCWTLCFLLLSGAVNHPESEMPHGARLELRDHTATVPIQIWEAYTVIHPGDMVTALSCSQWQHLGLESCSSWNLWGCPLPILPQGPIQTTGWIYVESCVEVQGPCWPGPTPHWPRMTFTPWIFLALG